MSVMHSRYLTWRVSYNAPKLPVKYEVNFDESNTNLVYWFFIYCHEADISYMKMTRTITNQLLSDALKLINVHYRLRMGTCDELQVLSQDWRGKSEMSSSGMKSHGPALRNALMCCAALLVSFFRLSGPWYSGWVVGPMHGHLEVALSRTGAIQSRPNASNQLKQQNTTTWITALPYQLPLTLLNVFKMETS